MKKDDIPRSYHFFCGTRFCRVPERLLIQMEGFGRPKRNQKLENLDVADALTLMRAKAAQYKRPFNIEVVLLHAASRGDPLGQRPIEGAVEVLIASRGQFTWGQGGPYRFLHRYRMGRGDAVLYHDTWQELMSTFEDRLARYIVGDRTALES